MLYYIVALIAEHTDLDAVASKDDGLRQALDKITQKSLAEHLFDLFLNYSEIIQAQQVPILCLGASSKLCVLTARCALPRASAAHSPRAYFAMDEEHFHVKEHRQQASSPGSDPRLSCV